MTADEYRRVLQHPDIEGVLSYYTAAFENVERCIEEILDGEEIVPEPYQNASMAVWRGQMAYLKAQDDGCPEEILENLRTFIVQSAHIQAQAQSAQMGAPPVQAQAAAALAPAAAVPVA